MRNFMIKEQVVSRPELDGLVLTFSSDPMNSAISRLVLSHPEHGDECLALTFNNGQLDTVRQWSPKDGRLWPEQQPTMIENEDGEKVPFDPHAAAEAKAQEETRMLQARAEGVAAQQQAQDDAENAKELDAAVNPAPVPAPGNANPAPTPQAPIG